MKRRNRGKRAVWGIAVAACVALCAAALWQGLVVRTYALTTHKVTASIRIAVLADLHDSLYGKEQSGLIAAIHRQEPDLVLLVGDIADDEGEHDATRQLLSDIGAAYPCYYVTGNHEYWSGQALAIKEMIRSYGVTILEGETATVAVRGQRIRLCGVDDPDGFSAAYITDHDATESWQAQFDACQADVGDEVYAILLSHRPERVEAYRNSGFDLVVAGHAHGGQVRIPGILNGLYAPNQDFFPEYAGGRYALGETVMIVSRGLSKGKLPRVFNPPELVILDLKPAQ